MSFAKIETLLQLHQEWLDSNGRSGRRATYVGKRIPTPNFFTDDNRQVFVPWFAPKDDMIFTEEDLLALRGFHNYPLPPLNLENSDFRGADFQSINLREANFTGADLQKSLFKGASLDYHLRMLEAHGVSSAEVTRLFADYDLERIGWHVHELERRLRGEHKIANPAAWLVKGIRDDYRPQQSMFAQEEEQRRAVARSRAERGEEIRAVLEKFSKEYRKYLLPAIETFLEQLQAKSADEYTFIEQEFQATLKSGFARDQFRTNGWSEPAIFNDAAGFFCQRYPAAFLTRAAYARHHNLGHPDSLAAELAEIEAAH